MQNTIYIGMISPNTDCISGPYEIQVSETDTFLDIFEKYYGAYQYPLLKIMNTYSDREYSHSDIVVNSIEYYGIHIRFHVKTE